MLCFIVLVHEELEVKVVLVVLVVGMMFILVFVKCSVDVVLSVVKKLGESPLVVTK